MPPSVKTNALYKALFTRFTAPDYIVPSRIGYRSDADTLSCCILGVCDAKVMGGSAISVISFTVGFAHFSVYAAKMEKLIKLSEKRVSSHPAMTPIGRKYSF